MPFSELIPLANLSAFAVCFLAGGLLFAVFVALYIRITPYHELVLIRDGNAAAAISLSGAMVGFALPVASVIQSSAHVQESLAWSAIALVVQLLAFLAARLLVRDLIRQIEEDRVAAGIFLAAISICIGLINAAAISG